MGPISLIDKSFLQSLTVDESVWFDHFFMSNIPPLFFVETLADLDKAVRPGRTPEDEVRIIAEKTPEQSANANAFHRGLVLGNLLGEEMPLDGRIVMSRGRTGSYGGQSGVLFEPPPEVEAFERWKEGKFLEVEKLYARSWRESVSRGADIEEVGKLLGGLGINIKEIRSLNQARDCAREVIQGSTNFSKTVALAFLMLGIPDKYIPKLLTRWESLGHPPITLFAPYAAFVFSVDLFFYISVLRGFLAKEKLSNRIDIAYLYYLPFCQVFISSDRRLHEKCAPLFLKPGQEFIAGSELKQDLAKINVHYGKLPEAEREKGIYQLAGYPPAEAKLVVRL